MDLSQQPDHHQAHTVQNGYLRTISGKNFSLVEPETSEVDIRDIAHSLSMICRYGGHIPEFYSVAQHSVLVSLVIRHYGGHPETQLQALLHDAAEAFMGDVIAPLKPLLSGYKDRELRVLAHIYDSLGVAWPSPHIWASIKEADQRVLASEIRDFMHEGQYNGIDIPYEPLDRKLDPLPWSMAESEFYNHFRTLKVMAYAG